MLVNYCARLEILKIAGLPFVEQDQAIMDFFCKISGVSGLWADLSIDERRDLVSSGGPDNIWFQCFEVITSEYTKALFPKEWSNGCSFEMEDYTNFFCREAVGTEFVNTGTGSVMRRGDESLLNNRWKVLAYLFLLSADDHREWKNPTPETYSRKQKRKQSPQNMAASSTKISSRLVWLKPSELKRAVMR